MEEFDAKGFKERVKLRLTVLGLSPRAASLQAGGSPDLIRNLLRGPNKTMRGDHMVNLARVLQVSVHWLMTGLEDPSMVETIETGVRFGGVVEAGTFRPVNLFNQDEEMRVVPLPPDPRYPRGAQYAFEVVGDSMTEAKILEGMYLLAVDIHAYERLHGEPQDGKLVIVARSRNGDPERELTVKRLRIFRDRLELRPESKNPLWQPLVFPNPPRDGEEVEAQIIAVVLAASWIYG